MDEGRWAGLDLERGRHEIPMLDAGTGEVRYGLDAMTWVLAARLPALAPLLRSPWLITSLKPLYWLITYNRRVIAGTRAPRVGFDCAPDLHLGWQWTYIALAGAAAVSIGLPAGMAAAGMVALAVGLMVSHDRLGFVGQGVTVALAASVVANALPALAGQVIAWGGVALEGWRRATPAALP